MGPIRRRLIWSTALLWPAPLWAEACAVQRPNWNGESVTALGELLFLLQSPIVLILIVATALAVRFRSEWGGLVVVVGWSISTFLVTGWGANGAARSAGLAEGCIGNPSLFIAVAATVCIGVVLYTAPLKRGQK